MAFNSGGTNVKGVQGIEQGTLTMMQEIESTWTGSPQTYDYEVPAGKIWVPKSVQIITSGGTVSSCKFYIAPSGADWLNMAEAAATSLIYTPALNMFIPAGGKIRQHITYSVEPTTATFRMLYQEIDA